jgi:aryl-alcohol dehydrogenase-like predicted oxidoreductase
MGWHGSGTGGPRRSSCAGGTVRDVLSSGGRTVAQGALAWIWARSDLTIPLPGRRTVAQVEENAGAMAFGPLSPDGMRQIGELLPS